MRVAPILAPWCLGLLIAGASAQTMITQTTPTPVLRPMSAINILAALERPVGQPVRAARTSGALELKGQQPYIAEYLLLWDLSGELPATARNGALLGTPLAPGPALLAYRSRPDVGALQALTDRAWADLQARLAAAGVVLADAQAVVRAHGAVYAATDAASTPAAPVVLESRTGDTVRRYLVLAPTGMRIVNRSAAGIGLGNPAARLAYPAHGVEGLSLAMAINLSALDTSSARVPSFASPGGLPTLSPLLELAPAPSAALVHAHAQLALVNLGEALVPAAEFGRLRPAPLDGPIPTNDPLSPLTSLGRRLAGDATVQRVNAELDVDGPTTARLALLVTSAANQAIADALKAAQ